jgi:exonuclease VII small subunit
MIMTFILCSTFCAAQNTVPKELYEKWVDYVNCRYLVTYIDKKIALKDGISNGYKQDYIEKHRSKLDINSLDEAPNYNGIKNIIGKFEQGKQLYEYINGKKGKLDTNWNKDKLIESLLDLRGLRGDFQGLSETTTLYAELQKQIPDGFFTKTEIPTAETRADEKIENTRPKRNFPWDWLILFVAGAVGGVFVRDKWVKNNNSGNAIEQSLRNVISNLENEKGQLENKIKQFESTIKNIERRYKELHEENIQLGQQMDAYMPKSSVEINAEQNRENQPVYSQASNSTASTLYADSIFDGFFNKTKETPNEETVFELHLQNAQNATFRIYHSAKPRIIANPAFLEGCDKQVLANAQNVKIVNEGSAQRQADGKWKIVTKLNVIIN